MGGRDCISDIYFSFISCHVKKAETMRRKKSRETSGRWLARAPTSFFLGVQHTKIIFRSSIKNFEFANLQLKNGRSYSFDSRISISFQLTAGPVRSVEARGGMDLPSQQFFMEALIIFLDCKNSDSSNKISF